MTLQLFPIDPVAQNAEQRKRLHKNDSQAQETWKKAIYSVVSGLIDVLNYLPMEYGKTTMVDKFRQDILSGCIWLGSM